MATFLSGYQVFTSDDDLLGFGQFGQVYKGRDTNRNIDVAVKKIPLYDDEDYQKYIRRELETMLAIEHAHVVKLHHSEKSKQFLYLVMEFCDGGDIESYIRKKGALQREMCLGFMQNIAEAVEYMHTRKHPILHRDLKPGNILLKIENAIPIIKLADFGLARPVSTAASRFSVTVCGSPNYMAPEARPDADGKVAYDLPVDVFSVGLIFLVLHNHELTRKPLEPIKGKEIT